MAFRFETDRVFWKPGLWNLPRTGSACRRSTILLQIMWAISRYPMLKHVINHKSGRGTDDSNGHAATRPWMQRGAG
jgi:hypothetical protein